MFAQRIEENSSALISQLLSADGNAITRNIGIENGGYLDNSFEVTIKTLLMNRVKDEGFVGRIGRQNIREIASGDNSSTFIRNVLAANGFDIIPNSLSIIGLNGNNEEIVASFRKLQYFPKSWDGFDEEKDLSLFCKKANVYCKIFTNSATKTAVVFVGNLDIRKVHLILSLISRIIPWHFEEAPLSDDEKVLVYSLTQRDKDAYVAAIDKLISSIDFRSAKIERVLGGFAEKTKQTRIRSIEDRIQNTIRSMNDCMASYRNYLDDNVRLNEELIGVKYSESPPDDELVALFKTIKGLDIIEADPRSFRFHVDTYLEYFDPEMFDRMKMRENSCLFDGYDHDRRFTVEVRKKILEAIFTDEAPLKVKMKAYYSLDLNGNVATRSGYNYPRYLNDSVPNPHLQRHACLGQHSGIIIEKLRGGDYVGAIMQCITSAKSVNLGESVSVTPLMHDLFGNADSSRKCIELPDGTRKTVWEAYQWLLENSSEG
jgi:hypothetical protein